MTKTSKGRSGDPGGVKVTSKWPYFNMMLFLKDSMSQRSAKGNIPSANTQENIHDENTMTDSDYDTNDVSDLKSDEEISNDNSLSTTPKTKTTEKPANNATIPTTGTSRKKKDKLDN